MNFMAPAKAITSVIVTFLGGMQLSRVNALVLQGLGLADEVSHEKWGFINQFFDF